MTNDTITFINNLNKLKAENNKDFMDIKNEILKKICNINNNEVSNVLNDTTKE